jgi:hypothetical protein
MRSNPFLPLALAVLFLTSSGLAHSQVEASASRDTSPFSIGAGASYFNVDWRHNGMYATTFWADWHPARIPSALRGLGGELEGRDINYDRPSTVPSNFRQDTLLGGPIYTLPRFGNFRPYVKALFGFGSFDFRFSYNPKYAHDTRSLGEYGGGFDYRAWHHVFVRTEYGYQDWESLFQGHNRNPRGFSLGVLYDFGVFRRR